MLALRTADADGVEIRIRVWPLIALDELDRAQLEWDRLMALIKAEGDALARWVDDGGREP